MQFVWSHTHKTCPQFLCNHPSFVELLQVVPEPATFSLFLEDVTTTATNTTSTIRRVCQEHTSSTAHSELARTCCLQRSVWLICHWRTSSSSLVTNHKENYLQDCYNNNGCQLVIVLFWDALCSHLVLHYRCSQLTSSVTRLLSQLKIATSSYATMVHGRRCNPHCSTTTFANLEITSLWRHNSETIRDR